MSASLCVSQPCVADPFSGDHPKEVVNYGYGSGRAFHYLPGKTDDERWSLVRKNLVHLKNAKKDEILHQLGQGVQTNEINSAKGRYFLTYRITKNAERAAFEDTFYDLRFELEKEKVVSVKVVKWKFETSRVGDAPWRYNGYR